MEQQYDMGVTEERARKIENILKELYEDQYNCKLVRATEKKDGASAQAPLTDRYKAQEAHGGHQGLQKQNPQHLYTGSTLACVIWVQLQAPGPLVNKVKFEYYLKQIRDRKLCELKDMTGYVC